MSDSRQCLRDVRERYALPVYHAMVRLAQQLLLLGLAFYASMTAAPLFMLPFRNPYNISNQYNSIRFNPDNNFYGLVFIIVGTVGLYYLLHWLARSRYRWLLKVFTFGLFLAYYFTTALLHGPNGYAPGPAALNNFHAGEQLSPAVALLSGKHLYDQIVFLRGAGIDTVFPAMALTLLGKSIGGFLIASDLFILLAQLAFFILLACIIKRPFRFIVVSLFFVLSSALSINEFRDVTVWAAIGLLLLLFRIDLAARWRLVTGFGLGLLASLMLYISIDRGVLLFGTVLLLAGALVLFDNQEDNSYQFAPGAWKHNIRRVPVYVIAGFIVGLVVPAALLGWHGFVDFVRLTFIEIPAYGGLLVSQPFPALFTPAYPIWTPVFLAIGDALLLVQLFRTKLFRQDLNTLLPYSSIFLFAALCIKMGSNRIDVLKMATVTAPLFLITLLLVGYTLRKLLPKPLVWHNLALPLIILGGTLLSLSKLQFNRLAVQPQYTRSQLVAYVRTPRTPDTYWMSPQTNQVVAYIKQHTAPKDYIYAFTSDPAYYYLANRANPSRFYISWYTDPQPYTTELLHSLQAHKPKLIIYSEGDWTDAPDNIPMQQRIPEVNDWILQQYPITVTIGSTVLRLPAGAGNSGT